MGKGKQRMNQQQQQQSEDKKNEDTSEATATDEKNESNKPVNPKGVIVLGVFIHCEGCAKTIYKSLRGFDGVEVIEIDSRNDKVTVKGAKADPVKVMERVRKKSGKHVDLISPVLPKDKKEEKKEEKKTEPKLMELTLKLNLHCEGCARDVKHTLYKLQGVQTVETDLKNSIVKVMGSMEAEKIVKLIRKKEKKGACVVKQEIKKGGKKDEQNDNNDKETGGGGGGGGVKKGGKKDEQNDNNDKETGGGGDHQKGGKKEKDSSLNYHNYPPHLVYAPQCFSDENPNACTIM